MMDKEKLAAAAERTGRAFIGSGRTLSTVIGMVLKVIGTIALIILTTGAIIAVIFSVYITRHLQTDMDFSLEDYSLNLSSFVDYVDKDTGQTVEMDTLHGSQNRVKATYAEIPEHVINAAVAIEDQRFWKHKGVDWKRTIGAFGNMFLSMRSNFGGSTLTQQLIKNLTNDKEVTVQRKVQEILRALEFEKRYKKTEILEWYLNTIYLGEGAYGIKIAALTYFNKELSHLTLAESACLVGIANSPTMFDPFLNPEKNKERQEIILNKMYEEGYISARERDAAKAQKLVFTREYRENVDDQRSFFTDQVYVDVVADLSEAKDISKQLAQARVLGGGYRITSTIDMRIQNIIDDVFQNDENFPVVKDSEKPQCAMLIIDPYTGDVVGMAGRRGEKEGNLVFNLATRAQRQPGSAIKPVAVYAPAIDMGVITPYSAIEDKPITLPDGTSWPKNYDGVYRGKITVTRATELSVNTVAVRVMEMITPERSFEFMTNNLGFTSLVREEIINTADGEKVFSDIVLSTALGGVTRGVTVKELTAAYSAFTNRGTYIKPRTYTMVRDQSGSIVLDNRSATTQAMKEKTAYYMNEILVSAVKNGTGRLAQLPNSMPTAGKTGTTTQDKDRWFVGYTPYYTAAVWFGFEAPKVIKLEKSTNPALAMWKMVMERVHEGLSPKEFFSMGEMVSAAYCMDSGLAVTDSCRMDIRGSRAMSGKFLKEDVPKTPCNLHSLVEICSESQKLAGAYCPHEVLRRVATVTTASSSAAGDEGTLENAIAAGIYCDIHTEDWVPPEALPEDLPEDFPGSDPGPMEPPINEQPFPTLPPIFEDLFPTPTPTPEPPIPEE